MVVKILVLFVILAGIGLFFLKGPNDEPFLTASDFMPTTDKVEIGQQHPETVTIYKWQDEDGVWHFSNEPVEVDGVETMEVDGDINLIPAVTASTLKSKRRLESKAYSTIPDGLTSVAPEKIAEMMETANNLQETIDTRKASVDKAVGKD
ncbi:MAG: DUF4124 domain-containing protein [Pseudomonadales bacterium]